MFQEVRVPALFSCSNPIFSWVGWPKKYVFLPFFLCSNPIFSWVGWPWVIPGEKFRLLTG